MKDNKGRLLDLPSLMELRKKVLEVTLWNKRFIATDVAVDRQAEEESAGCAGCR